MIRWGAAFFPAVHSPLRQIKQQKYNLHESLRQYRQINKSWFSEMSSFNPKKQKFPQKAEKSHFIHNATFHQRSLYENLTG